MEIGWTELLVIGLVALIVIGPKDLPEMFRTLGRFTAKARSMARDFQRAMESAADDAGVKDIAKDLKNVTSPKSMGLEAVKSAADKFEKWDPLKNAAKPTAPPPARPAATAAVATAAATSATATPTEPPTETPAEPQAEPQAETPTAAATDPVAVAKTGAGTKTTRGPSTQALAEKQATRKAIARDAADKLKAASVPTLAPDLAPASAPTSLPADTMAEPPAETSKDANA
jgi:sec-independent protein translocase protein TatB